MIFLFNNFNLIYYLLNNFNLIYFDFICILLIFWNRPAALAEYARPNFQLLLLAIALRLLSPAPIYFPLAAQQVEFFFDAAAN
jgi:hypothetical protein